MNQKSVKEKAKIIQKLCNGSTTIAACKELNVAKYTVLNLLVDVGLACEAYQSINLRNLSGCQVQADEMWSFVYSKEKNTPDHMKDRAGSFYTWTALCRDTKLVPTWLIGTREAEYADMFMKDLASRFKDRIELITDGHKPYPDAVEKAFGDKVDYARTIKNHNRKDGEPFIDKRVMKGKVDVTRITNNHVERQNGTMRGWNRRLARDTLAFSKKLENHKRMMGLYFMHYNYIHIPRTRRVTPAMAAGVTDHVWSFEEIVQLAEWDFKIN